MGLAMTGKVGPGGGVKTSRLIVSSIVLPRAIESHYHPRISGIGRPSYLAPQGAAVCARPSYGPGPRLSLWAGRLTWFLFVPLLSIAGYLQFSNRGEP